MPDKLFPFTVGKIRYNGGQRGSKGLQQAMMGIEFPHLKKSGEIAIPGRYVKAMDLH
jgi:hypothetical protein